jgi:catechol 2,3-dioxygenase-like lactoylglutathione lyase family enzyme
MFTTTKAFSGFSVDDVPKARNFYRDTLGLKVTDIRDMLLLHIGDGRRILVYPKGDHQPATYTILNFPVPDVAQAVDDLVARGVPIEGFPGTAADDKGIVRGGGPDIAYFRDPAGNILAVLQGE